MISTAVVGASGYSGAELVSLLAFHPEVELRSLHAESSAGSRFEDLHPRLGASFRGEIQAFEPEALADLDLVFLALPAEASARGAGSLAGRGPTIIDLSGGLRMPNAESYARWYGGEHPAPELLGKAAYGLPELHGCALPGARLVACAGCYATAAQLAVAPALKHLPVESHVVVNALSGSSGAGRKSSLGLMHAELHGDMRAYRAGSHQHAPEIAAGLTRHAETAVTVTFIPHLVPIERGLHVTAVLKPKRELDLDTLLSCYQEAYSEAPLVRVVDSRERMPRVRDVVGTSHCDVSASVDQGTGELILTAVIDNLLKGAAGQAVQVMNRVLGFPDTMGLMPKGPAS